jgi:hypothetical protein
MDTAVVQQRPGSGQGRLRAAVQPSASLAAPSAHGGVRRRARGALRPAARRPRRRRGRPRRGSAPWPWRRSLPRGRPEPATRARRAADRPQGHDLTRRELVRAPAPRGSPRPPAPRLGRGARPGPGRTLPAPRRPPCEERAIRGRTRVGPPRRDPQQIGATTCAARLEGVAAASLATRVPFDVRLLDAVAARAVGRRAELRTPRQARWPAAGLLSAGTEAAPALRDASPRPPPDLSLSHRSIHPTCRGLATGHRRVAFTPPGDYTGRRTSTSGRRRQRRFGVPLTRLS